MLNAAAARLSNSQWALSGAEMARIGSGLVQILNSTPAQCLVLSGALTLERPRCPRPSESEVVLTSASLCWQ